MASFGPLDYQLARDNMELGLNYHMTQSYPITTTRSDSFSIASRIEIIGNDTMISAYNLVDLYSDIYDRIVHQARELDMPDSTGEKFLMVVDLEFGQNLNVFNVTFQVGVKSTLPTSPGYCAPQWVVNPGFNMGGCGPDVNTAPSNTDGANEMNIRLNDYLCNPYVTPNQGVVFMYVQHKQYRNYIYDNDLGGTVPSGTFFEWGSGTCFTLGDQSVHMARAGQLARDAKPSFSINGATGKKSIKSYEVRGDFWLCGGCPNNAFHTMKVFYGLAVPLDEDANDIPKNLPSI